MWKMMAIGVMAITISAVADPVVISDFEHGSLEWDDSISNGVYTVEWASHPAGPWKRSWDAVRHLPATGGGMQVPVPMYYRLAHSAFSSMLEDFETEGGWSDHAADPVSQWFEWASSGVWRAWVGEFFAISDPARARSGQRCIGAASNGFHLLKLPEVHNPDHISYWVRSSGRLVTGSVRLEAATDMCGTWITVAETVVPQDGVYHQVTADPMWAATGQDPPITALRFRLEVSLWIGGGSILIDDVAIALEP